MITVCTAVDIHQMMSVGQNNFTDVHVHVLIITYYYTGLHDNDPPSPPLPSPSSKYTHTCAHTHSVRVHVLSTQVWTVLVHLTPNCLLIVSFRNTHTHVPVHVLSYD